MVTLFDHHFNHYIILKGWRSWNINRLIVTLFDLHLNLMHYSITPWHSYFLQRDNRLSNV